MDTNEGSEPMQEIVGPATQTTGGSKPLHRFLKGEPKTVGIVLLFLGLCLFIFGIPLKNDIAETSAEAYSPFWLGILYFICGVLYIQSERNPTKKIVTISLALSIIGILGTIIGAIIFSKTLIIHSHHMRYADPVDSNETDSTMEHYGVCTFSLCLVGFLHTENLSKLAKLKRFEMQIYSLEAVFLFHSLIAGVILIAMSVFARLALRSSHTQMLVVMRYPPSE